MSNLIAWPAVNISPMPIEVAPPATKKKAKSVMKNMLDDPILSFAADVLDDVELVRIANENRLRQLTRKITDSDGEERGFGLTDDHPDVKNLTKLIKVLRELEANAAKNLITVVRRHPLHPWLKAYKGLGERQGARLLAAIGDPYWNYLDDRARRGPAELWAYCGYIPGQKRKRGVKSNWSAAAKKYAFLVAESMLKTGNREIYDKRRMFTEDRLHDTPCVRCGPSGNPAAAGSPWSKKHQHMDALRIVAKALLRDLWVASKEVYQAAGGQPRIDAHMSRAASE
jgi:hypothetical protein